MSEEFYRQCLLQRVSGHLHTAWIPESFAHKGKFLKLKMENEWQNGWQVKEVYARASASEVLAHERDYLVQREASDV